MTFSASHSMASAPRGSQPGVSAEDYARHVLERHRVFAETIADGAVAHLHAAGCELVRPESWPKFRWQSLLFDIGAA